MWDGELGLVYYNYRYYNEKMGHWNARDCFGIRGGYNLYAFIQKNIMREVDILGLYLYAIDGTSYNLDKLGNVSQVYSYYKMLFSPPNEVLGDSAFYVPGTESVVRGSDCVDISEGVFKKICDDYCKVLKYKKPFKIDIVGWSRGAAIAIDIANQLHERGCSCCGEVRYPQINWLGLFDPVDMTLPFEGRELVSNKIPANVKSGIIIYATDRTMPYTLGLGDFKQLRPEDPHSRITEIFMITATHNDVGGEGLHSEERNQTSLRFMLESLNSAYAQ